MTVHHYDGMTPVWLAALRARPSSARDLAVTLEQSTSRGNVNAIRAYLEQMERKGLVTRSRTDGKPWIWEAVDA
jgi:DNA-binding PadR family transcriptional regulator